ncbi:hypothetical protein [uncultured Sulfitobacter sp.]|uniref:hypothetical protein n=1 Tax=uncultured Sulfitobacter sp. TaxID=191468 RepID=UPI00262C0FDC|nr:hypothetical protein [uncultured Sulfitobacter sp.]
MFVFAALYIALGFGALAALATMILRIGTLLGECPQSKRTARAASVTIATGFAAIGAGGVILVGAVLPLMAEVPLTGFLGALGFVALCLGLGFTQAVGTLRALMFDAQPKAPNTAAA